MIQKLRYILLILAALIGGESWAQTTSYVLKKYLGSSNEQGLKLGDSGEKLKLDGPGYKLTFKAKKGSSISVGVKLYIKVSKDGGNSWSEYYTASGLSTSYKNYECILSSDITHIQFVGNGSYKNWFYDVEVTRATTLSAPSSVNMGEVKIGKSISAQVNVDFNNTTYNQTLTGSCKNSAFTIVSRSMGECGTAPVTINFSPTTAGTHTGTVKLSMNGVTAEFSVTGSAQDKGTPAFTWNLSNLATGREYTDFFTSTNTDTPVSFVSGDASIANVVDGKLVTSSKEGTATITVTQQGNDDWHEKTQSFTVNVSKPQNHLPLAINESNWSVLARNISGGSFNWDGGIQHHAFAYGNREFEIAFQGIPDKLTFDHRVTDSNIDSSVKWTVYEGPDGNSFTEAWTTGTNNGTATVQLKPTTRYVRIKCYCIYYENVSNIQITELRYLTSSATSIDFGENVEGDALTKTFTLRHANAGYGVTLVSSNPDAFEVSPSTLTTTGGDKMGEETITVTYKNNTVGEHSGTITIADPNGTNAPVSVDLSATTISSGLILNPTQTPDYDVRTYKRVVLQRTLPMGYSTITLPFTYNIGDVEGGYVAQLELVTHNQQDGYTLYFKKVSDGIMHPHQPYVLYLPIEIANPEWGETAVSSPDAQNIQKAGWTMQANYTPGVSMEGKYGIVGGKLCLGGAGSTINAYTAYFIPPAEAKGRVRVAMLDNDGTTTYIHSLSDTESDKETTAIYRLDGTKQTALTKGINIVRMQDGSVRKVLK